LLVGKLTSDAALDPAGLLAVAICHGFALFVAVSVGANISGGHVNPAVTFGLALGGHITILTGLFYWIAQLLGSIVACFLLNYVTGGLVSLNSKNLYDSNSLVESTHGYLNLPNIFLASEDSCINQGHIYMPFFLSFYGETISIILLRVRSISSISHGTYYLES